MTPAKFLETRQAAWDRLEELLAACGTRGASALTERQLHELTRLYPAVAVDVARARMYQIDPATQQRINALAISAHGLLYRRPHARLLPAIGRFFARDYPRLFRQLWACLLLSTAIFVLGAAGSYVTTRLRPSTAYVFVPHGLSVSGGAEGSAVTARDVSQRYRLMPRQFMASAITTNNIQVAFWAFALGITAGVGTGYVLLGNAMLLGAFFGHFDNHRLSWELWSFVMPHGLLEIFAILVAGAAGLRLGLSLAIPGRLPRAASLKAGARQAVLLVLGTIPMFIVAGCIESFVTPSYLPGAVKLAVGLTACGSTLAYLLLAARPSGGPLAGSRDWASPSAGAGLSVGRS